MRSTECHLQVDAVFGARGCPTVVRDDFGTENVRVRDFQRFLRRNAVDERGGSRSYIDGASTSNQRIESWWGILRKESTEYWIKLFSSLKDEGAFECSYIDKSLI
jgi:hypothetical protein